MNETGGEASAARPEIKFYNLQQKKLSRDDGKLFSFC